MRKEEVSFKRALFDEDKRSYLNSNVDKIYNAVDNIRLDEIQEGESVLLATGERYTKINGALVKESEETRQNIQILGQSISSAVTTSHARQHSITSTDDHISSATSGKILKANVNGLPVDASNTDAEVASAVTLKHAQGNDIGLGVLGTKNPPIDADKVIYRDSAISDNLVTSTWTQIKAFLKSYFDTLYHTFNFNIIKPSADSTSAIKITKANGTTEIITIDTTNERVGIGMDNLTPNPSQMLELNAGLMQMNFIQAPGAGMNAALAGIAGNINNGQHWYYVVFCADHGGQTGYDGLASECSVTVIDKTVNGQVNLTNIPISANPKVISRKLYRTSIAQGRYFGYYLTTINDNISTTYLDNKSDSDLLITDYFYARPNDTAGKIKYKLGNTVSNLININDRTCNIGLNVLPNATGQDNMGIGSNAGLNVTTGNSNVFIGFGTGANTTSSGNTGIGISCLSAASSSVGAYYHNTAVGFFALRFCRSYENVAIGLNAGYSVTTGFRNTFIGVYAGYAATTNSNNINIGYYAGRYETGASKLIIDVFDRTNEATQRISAIIYGEMNSTVNNQMLRINAGSLELRDGLNIISGTTTGTKIGTATSQKLGFWNAAPVVQQVTIAYTPDTESVAYTGIDNAQAGTPYAQLTDLNALRTAYENLRVAYEDLIVKLKNTGIIA